MSWESELSLWLGTLVAIFVLWLVIVGCLLAIGQYKRRHADWQLWEQELRSAQFPFASRKPGSPRYRREVEF